MNMLTKLFLVFSIWTVGFLSLAVFASNRVLQNDPELISKIQEKYNITISKNGVTNGVQTQDSWTFAVPAKKVIVKSFSGNISIKKSSGHEIKITAIGRLDKGANSRLLETDHSSDELIIREPDNDVVSNLEVQIELPAAFENSLEVLSVSGDINLKDVNIHEIDLGSVSGDIDLNKVTSKNFVVKTVSGDVKAESSSMAKLVGKTVSGDFEISSATPLNSDLVSVSGDIRMKFSKTDKTQFSLQSVNGDIRNGHQDTKGAEYTVNISTTSGDIEVE